QCGDIKGIVAGSADGNPLVSGTIDNSGGSPVVNQAGGAAGPVRITMEHTNSAVAIEAGTAKTKTIGPDGAVTEFTFNKLGLPSTTLLTGYGASNAVAKYEYNGDGLITKLTE